MYPTVLDSMEAVMEVVHTSSSCWSDALNLAQRRSECDRASSRIGSRIRDETVANAADGDEVLRVGGVVFDVAAEADDEVVDGAGVGVFVDTPDLLEDLFAGDDLAFTVGEVTKEIGLHDGEVGSAVGGDELEVIEADGAVVEGVLRIGFVLGRGGNLLTHPCGPAQERLDAHEENVEIEGLGEVVVGARIEAVQDVLGA